MLREHEVVATSPRADTRGIQPKVSGEGVGRLLTLQDRRMGHTARLCDPFSRRGASSGHIRRPDSSVRGSCVFQLWQYSFTKSKRIGAGSLAHTRSTIATTTPHGSAETTGWHQVTAWENGKNRFRSALTLTRESKHKNQRSRSMRWPTSLRIRSPYCTGDGK